MPYKTTQRVIATREYIEVEKITFLLYPSAKKRPFLPEPWSILLGYFILSVITAGYFGFALINPPQAVLVISFKKELPFSVPVSPASLLQVEVPISLELPAHASGLIEIPSGYATGRVRFTSLEISPLSFLKNTLIWQKGGVEYRLESSLTVPGFGNTPGVAEGIIVAGKPGPEGNSPAFSSFMLSYSVRVQCLTPISGGTTRTAQVFTPSDLDGVKGELEKGLAGKRALALLQEAALPGYTLFPAVTYYEKEFTLPAPGAEFAGQVGKVRAVARAFSYNPSLLLNQYALPEDSELLGSPVFQSLDEGLVLHYSRPVSGKALIRLLKGWQGTRKEYDTLVGNLRNMPEVEELLAPTFPPDFRALSIKVVVYEKA